MTFGLAVIGSCVGICHVLTALTDDVTAPCYRNLPSHSKSSFVSSEATLERHCVKLYATASFHAVYHVAFPSYLSFI